MIETKLFWKKFKDITPMHGASILAKTDDEVVLGYYEYNDYCHTVKTALRDLIVSPECWWAYITSPRTKEFHVWLDTIKFPALVTLQTVYDTTKAKLNCREDIIHTTQTAFLKTSILDEYKLFVHRYGQQIEITLGSCQGTDREIKAGDNLEKLVLAGEFDFHE